MRVDEGNRVLYGSGKTNKRQSDGLTASGDLTAGDKDAGTSLLAGATWHLLNTWLATHRSTSAPHLHYSALSYPHLPCTLSL